MSVRVSVRQLQDQLPQLLDRTVAKGKLCVVERNGEDFAVLVSAREWKRRGIGKRLDALDDAHRLSADKQARAETLLTKRRRGRLAAAERNELQKLLRDCDEIMLRRAAAVERIL